MRPFERVLTMTDYYDGPRRGIANFDGRPHAYAAPFEYWKPDYADLYVLRAVDEHTLQLALEVWEIWLRWEAAFHTGTATTGSHPALPADRARHDELRPGLERRLAALPGPMIRARATFRRAETAPPWLDVRWAPDGAEPA